MNLDEKQKLAAKLIQITNSYRPPPPLPEEHLEALQGLKKKQDVLLAKIYAERFTDEQLVAQLEFYESDLGKSILKIRANIQTEYVTRLQEFPEFKTDTDEVRSRLRLMKLQVTRAIKAKKKHIDPDA